MLKVSVHHVRDMLRISVAGCQLYNHSLTSLSFWRTRHARTCLQYFCYTDDRRSQEENKRTLDSLFSLSVDVKKIRRLKAWVLLQDEVYVEETANILKVMGANQASVVRILERCPEAILQRPAVISAQKDLWRSVYPSDIELVKIIEQFPESFFAFGHQENQKDNIQYFLELGIKKKIVSRFLASAPDIFCNTLEKNKEMIRALEEGYLKFGGSEANMKIWLIKLLCQDPFILSKSTESVKNNLDFLQRLGFMDSEVLNLLSKLKGFIFDITSNSMESSTFYSKYIFKCSDEDLKQMVLKCPALLYYSVPVLKERFEGMLKEGISIGQIKECPSVLELTPQIVQYRIKKIAVLGYNIKHLNLQYLSGTKKDFEVGFNKMHTKGERPLFNPVAPLKVDD